MEKSQQNISNAKLLLEDAMQNQNYELMRQFLTPDATINRAGFADLYNLTADSIPQQGNFIEWLKMGWKPLSSALTEQTAQTTDVIASADTVIMKYRMTALHSGTFAGAPPTNKRVHWEEIAVLHFNDEGKCTDGWFMCQELSLAQQIGYNLNI